MTSWPAVSEARLPIEYRDGLADKQDLVIPRRPSFRSDRIVQVAPSWDHTVSMISPVRAGSAMMRQPFSTFSDIV